MTLITDIKSLDARGILLVGSGFVGLLVPGILSLYFYDRAFIIEASAIATILLSLSITAPSFVMLFVTTVIGEKVFSEMAPSTGGNFGGFNEWAITHSISNACIFFFVLLLRVLAGISVHAFVIWVLVLLFSYILFEFYRLLLLAKGKTNPYFHDPGNGKS